MDAQEKAERQQKAAGTDRRTAAPAATTKRAASQEKKKRTGARQFLKEVRLEMKKVDWPTRTELITYSTVVLVTITFMTAFVFGVDYVFTRFLVPIFN